MLEFTYTNYSKVIGMASITIDIQDTQLKKLQALADLRGLSPEDLLLASVEDLLSVPKSEFSQTADYVLKKNTELYHRLS